MKVEVSDLLRLKRIEKGQTLEDVAKLVGVSNNYISELEKGKKSNPSDEIVVKLAQVFSLNEDELFIAFNKIPLSTRNEIDAHPSLAKALSELNSDTTLSHEKKEQFYNKLVYWYKKLSEED